jgi:hypothetical protein
MTPEEAFTILNPPVPELSEDDHWKAAFRWFIDEYYSDVIFDKECVLEAWEAEKTGATLPDWQVALVERQKATLRDQDVDTEWLLTTLLGLKDNLHLMLKEPHGGDCTACPATCSRCFAESTYKLPSTVTWNGKSEGWMLYSLARKLEQE